MALPRLVDDRIRALYLDPMAFTTSRARPGELQLLRADGTMVSSLDELVRLSGGRPRWRPSRLDLAPVDERLVAVAAMLREGATSQEIAGRLGVSVRTVTGLRRQLREAAPVTPDVRPGAISVVGRRGLLLDLVAEVLRERRFEPVVGVSASVGGLVVAIAPTAREIEVPAGVRSIVVGALPDGLGPAAAVRQGVMALLGEVPDPDELVDAVENVVSGRAVFPDAFVQQLVFELSAEHRSVVLLTSRERDYVEGIARGESMKQSARRLGVSMKTVENGRQQLYRKLGVRTARAALAAVTQSGLE